ncbi:MAG TPA: sigma-54 dependent transcriptional regulator [Bryobacteraceae bacterium]|jgi:DNA-binding NtrC family response regulator
MRVLIVDDETEHRDYLAEIISSWNYEIGQAGNGEEALNLFKDTSFDIVLSDLMMPKMDGFELLRQLKAQGNLPPTILMTAFGSLERALHTIHELDGFWFLEKPIDLTALELLLKRAGAHRRLAIENQELRRQLSFTGVLGDLVGQTPAMQEIFALIRQVAPTSAAVLITGESGTGKELVARALHANSKRSAGPFVAINCAALPESLIESEIFGHEKGAFTGAVDRRMGAMEQAHGGTLFLDELGEMPMAMQAKLLRVLEDLRFRRLGGKQEIQADVRIIAATNRDPMVTIKDGSLREDLYYRLNVFQIHLPPLRERKEDIPRIVEAMITSMNDKHGTRVQNASPSFHETLMTLNWDGNVRELRNVVERAVIIAGEGVLEPRHAAFGFKRGQPPVQAVPATEANGGVGVDVGMTIDEAERLLIEATLTHTANNKTRAALILGISTKTLHVKLRQYRLDGSTGGGDDTADGN